jgi:hypothetical protein
VIAGYPIDAIIAAFGAVPRIRNETVALAHISLNYTPILNILLLAVSSLLALRFLSTGAPDMLRMMVALSEGQDHHHDHI